MLDRADIERIVSLEFRVGSLEVWRSEQEGRARDEGQVQRILAAIEDRFEEAEESADKQSNAGLGALARQYVGRPFAFLCFLFLVWLILREANENFPKLIGALGPIAKNLGL